MRSIRVGVFFFTMWAFLPGVGLPQPKLTARVQGTRTLRGMVVKLHEGFSEPVANANITLDQTGDIVTSNSNGGFLMPLLGFVGGEEVKLTIDVPGYAVYEPVDGRTRIPRDLDKDITTLELLPKGSPKFFSHEHLLSLLGRAASDSVEQVYKQQTSTSPDLTRYLNDWASRYGFGLERVRSEVERWITEVENKGGGDYELGVAEFAKKNFVRAGNLLEVSGRRKEEQLRELRRREIRLSREAIRDYGLGGDAYYNSYSFPKALDLYEKALSLVAPKEDPNLWATITVRLAVTHEQLGVRAQGEEALKNLQEAERGMKDVLAVHARETFPIQWAADLVARADILRELAERSEGPQAVSYLEEARISCQSALEVYTEGYAPLGWAGAQNNLGNVLLDRAERNSGKQTTVDLAAAIVSFQNALKILRQDKQPEDWATTQNNLGLALFHLAERTSDLSKEVAHWNESIDAFDAALQIRTREKVPAEWAMSQANLAGALQHLGNRFDDDHAIKYLKHSRALYAETLEIIDPEGSPQVWALVQESIDSVLIDLADRSSGLQAIDYLKQSLLALNSVLRIQNSATLPRTWGKIQSDLGVALLGLAQRTEGSEALDYFNKCMIAFNWALQVRTLKYFPQDWAETNNYRCIALTMLGERSQGKLSIDYLQQAADGFRRVLEIWTRDEQPQQWAEAQGNLDRVLRSLAKH